MLVISLKTFVDSLDIPIIDLDEQDFVRHIWWVEMWIIDFILEAIFMYFW